VDHMIPKSHSWDAVYEWSNYRLASHLMNMLKSDSTVFLDPFEIEDGWFGLELVDFQVILMNKKLSQADQDKADRTLRCLNQRPCCQLRMEYVRNYEAREVTFSYLERCSPFVARELRRQGCLLPGDA